LPFPLLILIGNKPGRHRRPRIHRGRDACDDWDGRNKTSPSFTRAADRKNIWGKNRPGLLQYMKKNGREQAYLRHDTRR
jgi:hypothetical protein